jgi:hypothetical protein
MQGRQNNERVFKYGSFSRSEIEKWLEERRMKEWHRDKN